MRKRLFLLAFFSLLSLNSLAEEFEKPYIYHVYSKDQSLDVTFHRKFNKPYDVGVISVFNTPECPIDGNHNMAKLTIIPLTANDTVISSLIILNEQKTVNSRIFTSQKNICKAFSGASSNSAIYFYMHSDLNTENYFELPDGNVVYIQINH